MLQFVFHINRVYGDARWAMKKLGFGSQEGYSLEQRLTARKASPLTLKQWGYE